MKLWLLRPLNEHIHWHNWYDKAFGFVVRAEDEAEARQLASKEAGDEDWSRSTFRQPGDHTHNPWLEVACSSCELLTEDGPAEIIIRDFASA